MTRSHAISRNVRLRCRRVLRPQTETLEGRLLLSAGDLDPLFGSGGYVLASSGGKNPYDEGRAVVIQPDKKILVSGSGASGLEVVRLKAEGILDTSFGSGGRAWPLAGGDSYDMALQIDPATGLTDGRVVLAGVVPVTAGTGKNSETQNDIAIVRLKNDGSLDTTFGQGGKVITGVSISSDSVANKSDAALAVAIQADGRIVVGGYTYGGSVRKYDSILLRYNTNGSLDDGSANDATPGDSFGAGGKIVTDWGGYDDVVGLAIQSDGKIVVAGQFEGPDSSYYVARYNTNGSLDGGFGTGGSVTGDPASHLLRFTHPLAIGPDDGSIILARSDFDGTDYHVGLARYTATGTPDGSFGGGSGAVTLNLPGTQYAKAVAIQPDGKLVVAGITSQDTIVARFESDGTRDTGFGSGGQVIRSFSSGSSDNFSDVALQADGKIVAVGTASIPVGRTTTPAFLIARYQNDSAAPSFMASRQATEQISLSLVGSPTELLTGTTESDQDLTTLATELVRPRTKRSRLVGL